ncbi:hypothetical protein V6N13_077176 [Hibiscus sabdariffa]|uniref:Uncharacterized protein n=1 Tax=Hibiscus sabdariffa TaxID=183260 RepID=A0ABR2CN35_9ROSI
MGECGCKEPKKVEQPLHCNTSSSYYALMLNCTSHGVVVKGVLMGDRGPSVCVIEGYRYSTGTGRTTTPSNLNCTIDPSPCRPVGGCYMSCFMPPLSASGAGVGR